jgi:hypothetical protein
MPMSYDDYQNKRSFIIDTAETPAQQKRLKAQLAALEAKYKAQKATPAAKPKTPVRDKTPDMARNRATERAQMLRGETKEDRSFREAMEKANWDPSKVPGFKIDRSR